MKKNYVSPRAECMTFQADAAIAACSEILPDWPNFPNETLCRVRDPGNLASSGAFSADVSCVWTYDDYCYYTHNNQGNLFGS